MIPIDNSVAGRVADIHHLLPTTTLNIVAEHFMRVRYDLLVLPGAQLKDLRTVHSHSHALGQCRTFITSNRLTPVTAADTAGAAREIRDFGDKSRGAISPPMAASVYGLESIASDVEDTHDNTTRFIVLSRDAIRADVDESAVVTTFLFTVRNVPSALYKVLGGFATAGVNLTKIESYMENGRFEATMFLAEIDGHPDEGSVKQAFEELNFYSTDFKILGVFKADPRREVGAHRDVG